MMNRRRPARRPAAPEGGSALRAGTCRPGRVRLVCLGLCAGLLLWGAAFSHGQERGRKGLSDSKDPLHVSSNKMEVQNQKNLVVFTGDVKAKRGDMHIEANRLEVYMRADEDKSAERETASPGGMGDLDKIVATGNVKMNQAQRRFATAGRLEYRESTGVAVLTDKPRAWEGKNQVVGSKIEMNLQEETTIVHGSPRRRVNVTLFPSSESETPQRQKSR